jgi:hypothetical protein
VILPGAGNRYFFDPALHAHRLPVAAVSARIVFLANSSGITWIVPLVTDDYWDTVKNPLDEDQIL